MASFYKTFEGNVFYLDSKETGVVYQALCNLAALSSNEETRKEALKLASLMTIEFE
jgi:hypothetical protein